MTFGAYTPGGTYWEFEEPECRLGYPEQQARELIEHCGRRWEDFGIWIVGQTIGYCDGRRYVHETEKYEQAEETAHGAVYYGHDIVRFLEGREVID